MDDIHSIFSSTLYPNRKCTANIQTGQPGTKKRKAICRTETDRKDGRQEYPFAYEETENYHVTASIRKQTQDEAIRTVLKGKPFNCIERTDYFVIQRKGKDGKTTQVRGTIYGDRNEPLAYANVILLAAADSAFITGCVTVEDGSFILPGNNEKNIC